MPSAVKITMDISGSVSCFLSFPLSIHPSLPYLVCYLERETYEQLEQCYVDHGAGPVINGTPCCCWGDRWVCSCSSVSASM